jgi:hypothetical protein
MPVVVDPKSVGIEVAWIKENVLSDYFLADVRRIARKAYYRPYPKGDVGEMLFLAPLPGFVRTLMRQAMEEELGIRLEEVISFFRLNTKRHDTEFRVHCDGIIQGQRPTHAAVFYLDTHRSSGTALFKHPTYGCCDKEQLAIFNEDDGLWDAYFKCPEIANNMFIYRTEMFHGRFPWQARGNAKCDGRIVIVMFMKETR